MKPRLTEAQIGEICRLREEENLRFAEIARRVGCSDQQARWWCRERFAIGQRDLEAFARGNHRSSGRARPFTPDETNMLLGHRGARSYRQLGRMLGRPPHSVRAHLVIAAHREAVAEEVGR